jgi:hypothetical protein
MTNYKMTMEFIFKTFIFKIAFHFSLAFRDLPRKLSSVHVFIRLWMNEVLDERYTLPNARTHARPPTRRVSHLRFVFALLLRLRKFCLQFVLTIWHKENQVVTMQELLL